MNNIVKDPLQERIEIANWIVLAVIFFLSLFFAPWKFSLGVLIGGFISIVNFHWLGRNLIAVFRNLSGNVRGMVMVKYYMRLGVTAVVLYFLISGGTVNVIGLLLGLSVVVINIAVTMITLLSKKNCLEEVS